MLELDSPRWKSVKVLEFSLKYSIYIIEQYINCLELQTLKDVIL